MPRAAVIALGLVLAGCGGPPAEPERQSTDAAPTPATAAPVDAPADTRAGPAPSPVPTASPAATASAVPADGTTAAAAQAVVRRYYAAIGSGDYAAARALWRQNGASSGMDAPAFARSFTRYAHYRATVGEPGRIDAGAGQRYVTVPVTVETTRRSGGAPVSQDGTVTLHRSGDIDGATAEQRAWRIEQIELAPPADLPETATARYACDDGSTLVAAFDNAADTVTLRSGTRTLGVLEGQRPASGIWYAGDGMTLRGKGDRARFTRAGQPPVACEARD